MVHLNTLSLIVINGGLSLRSNAISEDSKANLKYQEKTFGVNYFEEFSRLKRLFLFRGGDDINTFSTGEEWALEDVKECLYGMRETGVVSSKITSFVMPASDDIHHF